ncbi:MAG: GntP family permease [Flavobacteriaceae bacterium]|nr:GntP family permease [Flavobacteriaceae bacterium]
MELIVLFGAIAFIIFTTIRFKMHPVFSLTLTALLTGFFLGMSPESIIKAMTEGFGKTLSGIGLVIAFGTVIGTYLEKSGATTVLANVFLKAIGLKRSPLALNLAGYVISIPVFCDSGFIILSSLNKALSKKTGLPMLVFAVSLATGLYAAHVFVPPTPGPLAAAAMLDADLGTVLLLGLAVSLPVSLTGYIWARLVGKSLKSDSEVPEQDVLEQPQSPKPTAFHAFLPLLSPVVLIALKSIANYPTHPFGQEAFFKAIDFLGNPIIALLVGVLFAFLLGRKIVDDSKKTWVPLALKQAGLIILITGAGGAFGAILRTIDLAGLLALESGTGISGLLIAFAIAALLKTAQGSSTVAIITTAAIFAPLLTAFSLTDTVEVALTVLAIGAGAMTVSHINDSYFWVVSQFSGMDVKTALKGHSLATLFQGLVGIGMILFLYLLL